MQLNHIVYNNFRCFKESRLTLHPRLTAIVGANGAGKTASMEGIAVALGTFIGAFDEAKGWPINPSDARRERIHTGSIECEPQYPVAIEAEGSLKQGDQPEHWSRSLTGKKSKTTVVDAQYATETGKSLQTMVRKQQSVSLPIIAFYGAGRLWGESRLTKTKKQTLSESRTLGYHESMNPTSGYKEFAYWFKKRKALDAIFQGQEPTLTEADLYIENRQWEPA